VKSVLICTLPRTGSSLLAADMRSTNALGTPREFFNRPRYERLTESWGIPQGDLDAYIKKLHAETASPNGVLAVKLMVRHLDLLTNQGMLPSEPGRLRNLTQHFGDVVVIKLLRKDKLRQAISLTKAQQTGKWGALKEQQSEPFYDREALIANLVRIVEAEAMWERELEASQLPPAITIDYEDIPLAREELLLQIAELLELPQAAEIVANRDRGEVKLERQSDDLTEEWYDRFISG
jgi:LPS sulfotransferase NodH